MPKFQTQLQLCKVLLEDIIIRDVDQQEQVFQGLLMYLLYFICYVRGEMQCYTRQT